MLISTNVLLLTDLGLGLGVSIWSRGVMRKHISTGEQTVTQHRTALHQVNACSLWFYFCFYHSPSSPSLPPSSAGVLFLLQWTVFTENPHSSFVFQRKKKNSPVADQKHSECEVYIYKQMVSFPHSHHTAQSVFTWKWLVREKLVVSCKFQQSFLQTGMYGLIGRKWNL